MQFISAELQEVLPWLIACLKVSVCITCTYYELKVQEFFPRIEMGKELIF
jgi:hypothetical protein